MQLRKSSFVLLTFCYEILFSNAKDCTENIKNITMKNPGKICARMAHLGISANNTPARMSPRPRYVPTDLGKLIMFIDPFGALGTTGQIKFEQLFICLSTLNMQISYLHIIS